MERGNEAGQGWRTAAKGNGNYAQLFGVNPQNCQTFVPIQSPMR